MAWRWHGNGGQKYGMGMGWELGELGQNGVFGADNGLLAHHNGTGLQLEIAW